MTTTSNSEFEVLTANNKFLKLLKLIVFVPYILFLGYFSFYIYTIILEYGFNDTAKSNVYSLLILFLPLIFLVFPKIFMLTGKLSSFYTFLSFKKKGMVSALFSAVPILSDLEGDWVMERNSERKNMSSIGGVIKFYLENFNKFILYPLAGTALAMQIYLNTLDQLNPESGGLPINSIFFSGGHIERPQISVIHWILLLTTVFAILNQILWKIKDSELKIMNVKESSKGGVNEISSMYSAVNPIQDLLSIVLGVGSVIWFYNQITYNIDTDPTSFFSTMTKNEIIGNMLLLFLFMSFMLWLLGYFYYQSGVHEQVVNNFRTKIFEGDKIPVIEVNITTY